MNRIRNLLFLLLTLWSGTAWGQTTYGYRYWFDNDLSTLGTGAATGEQELNIDISQLRTGSIHALHFQARSLDNQWSAVRTRYFLRSEEVPSASVTACYWFDNDISTKHTAATSGVTTLDISKLSIGMHAVHYQSQDAYGTVSAVRTRYFYVDQIQIGTLSVLISIDDGEEVEYELSDEDIVIDVSELSIGMHELNTKLIDSNGQVLGQDTQEFEIPIPTETITITAAGEGTFCSEYDLDFSEVIGLKAYIASGYIRQTGTVILMRVTDVPAYEGLMVKGEPGTYKVPHTVSTAYYANMFKGNVEPTTIYSTDGEYTNYYLSNGSNGLGFYRVSSSRTMSAHRAYMQLPTTLVNQARAIRIIFSEDEITGISEVSGKNSDGYIEGDIIYDMQGRQVIKPAKGLYIKNGKKVIIE